jgi:prophage maintenance system killer protein
MFLLTSQYLQLCLPSKYLRTLAELNQYKGRHENLQSHSVDLLAGIATSSWNRATSALNKRSSNGLGFDYVSALERIYNEADSKCLQTMHKLLNKEGGSWRQVKLRNPKPYHFNYLSPGQIPGTTIQLLAVQNQALEKKEEALIIAPLLLADLLRTAPFLDGNRRVALLQFRQFLDQAGHHVLRYIDIESELIATENQFYTTLNALLSKQADTDEALFKWLSYWWVLLKRAYQRFEKQLNNSPIRPGRGSKTQLIEHFALRQQQAFQLNEVCKALPTISIDMIKAVLRDMRDRDLITTHGHGRGASWQKR